MNKQDFPIFNRTVNGKKLVYLDSAATAQKPQVVIAALVDFYTNHNANVHRGIHTLSEEATKMYEQARKTVAKFIGAESASEIVFTKGTTEALNRVAFEWALENIGKEDVILATVAEHHSNLLPWQIIAQRTGAQLKFLDVNANGELSLEQAKRVINTKVKLIAISHASNVLGTIFPIKKISQLAKKVDAKVVVDGAQAVPHIAVNVQKLGCDFYAFSGHKMLGPTGIGVLWAKKAILEKMEPYEYGGGMIKTVDLQTATWTDIPEKFEAGTPNVAGAIGLAAAINYLDTVGMTNIRKHEIDLTRYALDKLTGVKALTIWGPKEATERTGLITFTIDGIHGHDLATILDQRGIAVRSGHHCTQPLHKKLEIPNSTRASFYLYNTKEDIDKLLDGMQDAISLLKKI